jgi:hypothetical protein
MKPPVIIIGAHRSGTSATAHALLDMGLFLGAHRMPTHDESYFFYRLQNDYLKSVGATWYEPQPFLDHIATEEGREHCRQYLEQHVKGPRGFSLRFYHKFGGWRYGPLMALGRDIRWGWKDPRTTLFTPIWMDLFPDAKVLHIVRHPLDIALSLQSREFRKRSKREGRPFVEQMGNLDCCFYVAVKYVEQGCEMATLGERYREIRFEDIQDAPNKFLTELADFCELSHAGVERAAAEIDQDRRNRWQSLPPEEVARLMESYPLSDRFGYSAQPDAVGTQ